MTKLTRNLLLALSITTGFIAIFFSGVLIRQHTTSAYSPVLPAERLYDPFLVNESELPPFVEPILSANRTVSSLPSVTLVPAEETLPLVVEQKPEWMTFDGLDLFDQVMKVTINLACDKKSIILPGFNLYTWYPEVFDDGIFDVAANSAIAWEHLGYHGLWMHSGQDILGRRLTAFNLHNYLERDSKGLLRNPAEFDKYLQECLVGSIVRLEAGGKTSLSHITAGARVPAKQVEELSGHVMDLVPYLAEQYPESGFIDLETPGLLFYFCGRQLVGESKDPNSFFWAQARIIIAMEPLTEDYFR